MGYFDMTMADNPVQYYPLDSTYLDENAAALDSDFNFTDLYFMYEDFPLVPPHAPANAESGCYIDNYVMAFRPGVGEFTLEFWVRPQKTLITDAPDEFYDAGRIIGYADSGVYYLSDRFRFQVVDTEGKIFYADVQAPRRRNPYYVVARYSASGIDLIVNGVASEQVSLVEFSGWPSPGGEPGISVHASSISNIAVYSKVLPTARIIEKYAAGTPQNWFRDIVKYEEGTFFDCSTNGIPSGSLVVDNFDMGSMVNIFRDTDGMFTLPNNNDIEYVGAGPAWSGGWLTLGADTYLHKPDGGTILSDIDGYLSMKVNFSSFAAATGLLSIYSPSADLWFEWTLNTSGVPIFKTYSFGEESSSVTYDSAIATGDRILTWTFRDGTVGLAVGDTLVATDGETRPILDVVIPADSLIYIGTDHLQTMAAPAKISDLAISSHYPSETQINGWLWDGSTYSDLIDYRYAPTVYHPLGEKLGPVTFGMARAETYMPIDQAFKFSRVTLMQTDYPETINLNNDSTSASPKSLGQVEVYPVDTAPDEENLTKFAAEIVLSTEPTNIPGWVPRVAGVRLDFFYELNFPADNAAASLELHMLGDTYTFPEYQSPVSGDFDAGIAFGEDGGILEFVSEGETADGNEIEFWSVEFLYKWGGGASTLFYAEKDSTEYTLSVDGDGLLAFTNGTAYLNGVEIDGSQYVPIESWCLLTFVADEQLIDPVILINGEPSDENTGPGAFQQIAIFEYGLSTEQAAFHHKMAIGDHRMPMTVINEMNVSQIDQPIAYQNAWETTSAT